MLKPLPLPALKPLPPLPAIKPKLDLSTWAECDTECVRNYWLCKFYMPDGSYREFAQWPGSPLDTEGLRALLHSLPGIITFNGVGYDNPMIAAALAGADCETLKNLNDAIIPGKGKQGVKPWDFYRNFRVPEPTWNMIDIQEPTPGVRISLKIYGGRMHSKRMQDLPFDPFAWFEPIDRLFCSMYCGNDLITTRQLKETIMPRLKLRHEIGLQYGIDVMSKSDAQIAEAVFRAKLPFKPEKIWLPHGHTFKYVAPPWLSFVSPELQAVLAMTQRVDFILKNPDELKLSDDEKVYDQDGVEIKSGIKFADELKGLDIKIGKALYRMGIGGLHSKEKKQHFKAVPGKWSITDHDVNSYYPTLMLLMGMYPKGTGPLFLEIFREIYDTRLHAKAMQIKCEAEGDKTVAADWKTISEGLKIVLNGTYGKLGSKYSFLFAPELMIRTTISGQLALLMLIEAFELSGIRVVSANTDGIVVITPVGLEWLRDQCIKSWELKTGLETEATEYTAVYNANVNNYFAFKPDGTYKAKGWYGESGVVPKASPSGKSPGMDVCNDAVIAFLRDGTPVSATIMACKDVKRFIIIKNANNPAGGAIEERTGENVGKALRYYFAVGVTTGFRYAGNGNLVAGSTGTRSLMELPDELPADVDYSRYIQKAMEMIRDLGLA